MGASNATHNRVENWWQKNAIIVKSMYHVLDIEIVQNLSLRINFRKTYVGNGVMNVEPMS